MSHTQAEKPAPPRPTISEILLRQPLRLERAISSNIAAMRLLNTKTLELKEFYGDVIPPYAILSHTWVDGEEISYHEFIDLDPSNTTKSGFHKVQGACRIAQQDGVDWIWIDTNCIDKTSSAELTEAINSMYDWYRKSDICYAYLCDVPDPDPEGEQEHLLHPFHQSRWFRRGWTLQELIAPRQMRFYSQSWTKIGDRSGTLASEISAITGIDVAVFQEPAVLHQMSVAKKMAWAARRETGRVEDIAYCLLGIFDVNMPLLYGEGPKSFIRLQEEIIKTSNDHTIFCWTRNASVPHDWTSMLAPSPAAFVESADYVTIDAWDFPTPYSMTNLGLSIHLPIIYTLTQMFVVLDAGLAHQSPDMRACVAMQRTNPRRSGSNILDRSRLLDGPVILSKDATDTRERYNLFIRSRWIAQPLSDRIPASPPFSAGVLLFVHPTATRLLSTGKGGMPLGSIGYDIETHPSEIFDFNTCLLRLRSFEGGSPSMTSGLMRIRFKSPQEEDFYLFFAVIPAPGGEQQWHCSVHPAEDFQFTHYFNFLKNTVARGDDHVLSEQLLIHQYLQTEALELRHKRRRAHSSDESLFLHIGGPIFSGTGGHVRAALLSGEYDSTCPVPSNRERDGSTDEETDGYADDSEDGRDGDWDSELGNEEDEMVNSFPGE